MLAEILMKKSYTKKGKNLIGTRFGDNCIVLAYVGINKYRTSLWLVRCNCGYEFVVQRQQIIGKKHVKSCQKCGYKKMGKGNIIDMVGHKFGNDCKIINFIRTENRISIWNAKCRCGKMFEASRSRIFNKQFPIIACPDCSMKISVKKRIKSRTKNIDNTVSPGGLKIIKRMKSNNRRLLVECVCGKQFDTSYIALFNPKRPQRMCFKCSYKKLRSGSNNHNWNPDLTDEERQSMWGRFNLEGYQNFWNKIIKKYKYTCSLCNSRKLLIVHHIDGWNWCKEKRMDENNVIVLCKVCHYKFHDEYGRGNNTKLNFKSL